MAKNSTIYKCTNCDYETLKWMGKCPSCDEWNTLEEKVETKKTYEQKVLNIETKKAKKLDEIDIKHESRMITNISELDRVLGGGIVPGSLVLIAGAPGVGKSTILLSLCKTLKTEENILYVSGEESASQIKRRADRLFINKNQDNYNCDNLYILSENNLLNVLESIKEIKPKLIIIDSIQTVINSELPNSAGSVTQIKECTNLLMKLAKQNDISIIIVGHITKEGSLAGPKVLEHMVDTVLYFEGENIDGFRILRAHKNRFGSTNEIGVFDMTEKGLVSVDNPSKMLLSGSPIKSSGVAITCTIEGTRPLLALIQGLTTNTNFGLPRRVSQGFDVNRLNLILAVLEKRLDIQVSDKDAYINVVGGIKLLEPASDLAIALSIMSSSLDKILDDRTVLCGEIGLSSEVRPISFINNRIKEAERLGFRRIIVPKNCKSDTKDYDYSIDVVYVSTVIEAYKEAIKES